MKTCCACKVEQPVEAFHFAKNRADGLYPSCRSCASAASRVSYLRHSSARKAGVALWQKANAAKVAASARRRYLESRESTLAKQRDERKANPGGRWEVVNRERSRETTRAWRIANPEKYAAQKARAAEQRRATKQTAEQMKAACNRAREWRAKNLARAREICRQWRMSNPERAAELARKGVLTRRARIRGAYVETVDPMKVYSRDCGVCGICSRPVEMEESWHVDHVIPLSRGGEHSYANVQLAHATCNKSKGSRLQHTEVARA